MYMQMDLNNFIYPIVVLHVNLDLYKYEATVPLTVENLENAYISIIPYI